MKKFLPIFLLATWLFIPTKIQAADNMCNVDRVCNTPQEWEQGWGDARKEENADATPVRTEWTNANDDHPEIIRLAGESNRINRSQKAADDSTRRGGDIINSRETTRKRIRVAESRKGLQIESLPDDVAEEVVVNYQGLPRQKEEAAAPTQNTAPAATPTASVTAQTALQNAKCDVNFGLCQAIDPQTGAVTGWVPSDKAVFCDTSCAVAARMNVVVGVGYQVVTTSDGQTLHAYDWNGDIQESSLKGVDAAAIKKVANANKVQIDSQGNAIINLTEAQIASLQLQVNSFSEEQNQVQQTLGADIQKQLPDLLAKCGSCTADQFASYIKDQKNFNLLTVENQTAITASARTQASQANIIAIANEVLASVNRGGGKSADKTRDILRNHPELSPDEISQIESLVNKQVSEQTKLQAQQDQRQARITNAAQTLANLGPEMRAAIGQQFKEQLGEADFKIAQDLASDELQRRSNIATAINNILNLKASDPVEAERKKAEILAGLDLKDQEFVKQQAGQIIAQAAEDRAEAQKVAKIIQFTLDSAVAAERNRLLQNEDTSLGKKYSHALIQVIDSTLSNDQKISTAVNLAQPECGSNPTQYRQSCSELRLIISHLINMAPQYVESAKTYAYANLPDPTQLTPAQIKNLTESAAVAWRNANPLSTVDSTITNLAYLWLKDNCATVNSAFIPPGCQIFNAKHSQIGAGEELDLYDIALIAQLRCGDSTSDLRLCSNGIDTAKARTAFINTLITQGKTEAEAIQLLRDSQKSQEQIAQIKIPLAKDLVHNWEIAGTLAAYSWESVSSFFKGSPTPKEVGYTVAAARMYELTEGLALRGETFGGHVTTIIGIPILPFCATGTCLLDNALRGIAAIAASAGNQHGADTLLRLTPIPDQPQELAGGEQVAANILKGAGTVVDLGLAFLGTFSYENKLNAAGFGTTEANLDQARLLAAQTLKDNGVDPVSPDYQPLYDTLVESHVKTLPTTESAAKALNTESLASAAFLSLGPLGASARQADVLLSSKIISPIVHWVSLLGGGTFAINETRIGISDAYSSRNVKLQGLENLHGQVDSATLDKIITQTRIESNQQVNQAWTQGIITAANQIAFFYSPVKETLFTRKTIEVPIEITRNQIPSGEITEVIPIGVSGLEARIAAKRGFSIRDSLNRGETVTLQPGENFELRIVFTDGDHIQHRISPESKSVPVFRYGQGLRDLTDSIKSVFRKPTPTETANAANAAAAQPVTTGQALVVAATNLPDGNLFIPGTPPLGGDAAILAPRLQPGQRAILTEPNGSQDLIIRNHADGNFTIIELKPGIDPAQVASLPVTTPSEVQTPQTSLRNTLTTLANTGIPNYLQSFADDWGVIKRTFTGKQTSKPEYPDAENPTAAFVKENNLSVPTPGGWASGIGNWLADVRTGRIPVENRAVLAETNLIINVSGDEATVTNPDGDVTVDKSTTVGRKSATLSPGNIITHDGQSFRFEGIRDGQALFAPLTTDLINPCPPAGISIIPSALAAGAKSPCGVFNINLASDSPAPVADTGFQTQRNESGGIVVTQPNTDLQATLTAAVPARAVAPDLVVAIRSSQGNEVRLDFHPPTARDQAVQQLTGNSQAAYFELPFGRLPPETEMALFWQSAPQGLKDLKTIRGIIRGLFDITPSGVGAHLSLTDLWDLYRSVRALANDNLIEGLGKGLSSVFPFTPTGITHRAIDAWLVARTAAHLNQQQRPPSSQATVTVPNQSSFELSNFDPQANLRDQGLLPGYVIEQNGQAWVVRENAGGTLYLESLGSETGGGDSQSQGRVDTKTDMIRTFTVSDVSDGKTITISQPPNWDEQESNLDTTPIQTIQAIRSLPDGSIIWIDSKRYIKQGDHLIPTGADEGDTIYSLIDNVGTVRAKTETTISTSQQKTQDKIAETLIAVTSETPVVGIPKDHLEYYQTYYGSRFLEEIMLLVQTGQLTPHQAWLGLQKTQTEFFDIVWVKKAFLNTFPGTDSSKLADRLEQIGTWIQNAMTNPPIPWLRSNLALQPIPQNPFVSGSEPLRGNITVQPPNQRKFTISNFNPSTDIRYQGLLPGYVIEQNGQAWTVREDTAGTLYFEPLGPETGGGELVTDIVAGLMAKIQKAGPIEDVVKQGESLPGSGLAVTNINQGRVVFADGRELQAGSTTIVDGLMFTYVGLSPDNPSEAIFKTSLAPKAVSFLHDAELSLRRGLLQREWFQYPVGEFKPGKKFTLATGEDVTVNEKIGQITTRESEETKGSFQATIYRGTTRSGNPVAIKIYRNSTFFGSDSAWFTNQMARNLNAAEMAIYSQNPNAPHKPAYLGPIVQNKKTIGLVTELIDGQTVWELADKTLGGTPLTPHQAEVIITAHRALVETTGQPHGDLVDGGTLHSRNVILGPNDTVYFIDQVGTGKYVGPADQESVSSQELIEYETLVLPRALREYTATEENPAATLVEWVDPQTGLVVRGVTTAWRSAVLADGTIVNLDELSLYTLVEESGLRDWNGRVLPGSWYPIDAILNPNVIGRIKESSIKIVFPNGDTRIIPTGEITKLLENLPEYTIFYSLSETGQPASRIFILESVNVPNRLAVTDPGYAIQTSEGYETVTYEGLSDTKPKLRTVDSRRNPENPQIFSPTVSTQAQQSPQVTIAGKLVNPKEITPEFLNQQRPGRVIYLLDESEKITNAYVKNPDGSWSPFTGATGGNLESTTLQSGQTIWEELGLQDSTGNWTWQWQKIFIPLISSSEYDLTDNRDLSDYLSMIYIDDPKRAQEILPEFFPEDHPVKFTKYQPYSSAVLSEVEVPATQLYGGLDNFYKPSNTVLELGSGKAIALQHLSKIFPKTKFIGIDTRYLSLQPSNIIPFSNINYYNDGWNNLSKIPDHSVDSIQSVMAAFLHGSSGDYGQIAGTITRVAKPGAVLRVNAGIPPYPIINVLLEKGWEVYQTGFFSIVAKYKPQPPLTQTELVLDEIKTSRLFDSQDPLSDNGKAVLAQANSLYYLLEKGVIKWPKDGKGQLQTVTDFLSDRQKMADKLAPYIQESGQIIDRMYEKYAGYTTSDPYAFEPDRQEFYW